MTELGGGSSAHNRTGGGGKFCHHRIGKGFFLKGRNVLDGLTGQWGEDGVGRIDGSTGGGRH